MSNTTDLWSSLDLVNHRQLFEVLPRSGNSILFNTVSIRNVGRSNQKCSPYVFLNQTASCAQDETSMSSKFTNLGAEWIIQDSGEEGIVTIQSKVQCS